MHSFLFLQSAQHIHVDQLQYRLAALPVMGGCVPAAALHIIVTRSALVFKKIQSFVILLGSRIRMSRHIMPVVVLNECTDSL